MRLLIIFVICCAFCFVFQTGQAQQMNYLGLEHGLPNNNVNTIYKDSYGFMWFGTFDGLTRYDGNTFYTFRNRVDDTTSLPDKEVYAIAEDRRRNLWVGTTNGVAVLDNQNFKFSYVKYLPYGGPRKAQLINSRINEIKFDVFDNTYICTTHLGLLIKRRSAPFAETVPLSGELEKARNVTALNLDRYNRVWFLLDGLGLCVYDPSSKATTLKARFEFTGNSFVIDKAGSFWIASNNGLYQYAPSSGSLNHIQSGNLQLEGSRLYRVRLDQDHLWVMSDGFGAEVINTLNGKSLASFQHGGLGTLTSNVVLDGYFDDEGRKWLATIGGGLSIIDQRKNQFMTLRHELNNNKSLVENTVYSICEMSKEEIWIGTEGGGISVWNRSSNTFANYHHEENRQGSLINDRVSSILKQDPEHLLISTYGGGICSYDRTSQKFTAVRMDQNGPDSKYVVRLFEDSKSNIWAACIKGRYPVQLRTGLYLFDRNKKLFHGVGYAAGTEIFSIAENKEQHLLAGTLTGILDIDLNTKKVKKVNTGTIVRSILVDKSDQIWLGTYGKGLMKYNSGTGGLTSFNENQGLCNNTVLNMEEDEAGNLWISTYYGLSEFRVKEQTFRNYYAEDGLQSNQFFYNASARLSSGELAFGGIRGLTIFKPWEIRRYDNFPKLVVTGIRIANDPVFADNEFLDGANSIYDIKELTLPYEKSFFSINYVALEYSQPDKIKYAYYFEGRDKMWNYVNNLKTINYSKLNEGHYRLLIKSTNSSGIWNRSALVIQVIVHPPWYRSWWAYLLYISAFISTIYLYLSYQRKQDRLRYQLEVANLMTKQEKDLNEKKIAFFTNISHELRAPLTLILNPIKELINENGRNYDLIDIRSVYRNAKRLLSLVDQLLLFRKTENEVSDLTPFPLNLVDVCREVFYCFNNQASAKELTYLFESEIEKITLVGDREKIEIILFNLLSNAVKFTKPGGEVIMRLTLHDGRAVITIADGGPGIQADTAEKLFDKFYRAPVSSERVKTGFGIGLFLAKKFTDLHEGNISFKPNNPTGTIFTVELPYDPLSEQLLFSAAAEDSLYQELMMEITEPVKYPNEEVSEKEVTTDKPMILIVDDDVELRGYLRKTLKLEGYLVEETDNAEEGIVLTSRIEPDLIVSDVLLPQASGVEFCSRLKNDPATAHIPIILLTSSTSPDVKLKGIECGADDYISKPFDREFLKVRIASILKGRQRVKTYFLNEITLKNNSVKIPEEYSVFLYKCIDIVEKHLTNEEFNVKELALEVGMSHSNLFKKIKSISGTSVNEFIRLIRLRKAAELMIQTDLQIKEIAFKVGFQQIGYFRKQFTKVFNMTPSEFISKHRSTFNKRYKLSGQFDGRSFPKNK